MSRRGGHSFVFACSVALSVSAVAVISLLSERRRRALLKAEQEQLTVVPVAPVEATWLMPLSFCVLTAICDTFIPALRLDKGDLTQAAMEIAIGELGLSLSSFEDEDAAASPNTTTEKRLLANKDVVRHLERGAVESGVPERIAGTLQKLALPKDKFELNALLFLLGTSVGCTLLTSSYASCLPFHLQSLQDRVQALGVLRDARVPQLRAAYQAFKRLVGFMFMAYAERGGNNPSWKAIEYDPASTRSKTAANAEVAAETAPTPAPAEAEAAANQAEQEPLEMSADVVIVGSGCGGGMMASELVKAGVSVILLEKGGHYDRKDFAAWSEAEAMSRVYERGGLVTSSDGNIVVLAGAAVGGGSLVNWSASFATPSYVLEDWASQGLEQFRPGGAFEQSMRAVHSLLSVNSNNSHRHVPCTSSSASPAAAAAAAAAPSCRDEFMVNRNNSLLWEAATSLGYSPEKIPRNVSGCVDCGSCCFGCSHGSKQSTIQALLEPLLCQQEQQQQQQQQQQPSSPSLLRLISHCEVNQVLFDNKPSKTGKKQRAIGVQSTIRTYPAGQTGPNRSEATSSRSLVVKAKIVIVCAGALHTPALLLRSKLTHGKIGKHLCLHPVLGSVGVFNKERHTNLAAGVSMGVVVRNPPIGQLPYPVALQTPPIHQGICGMALPWKSGLQFKLSMLWWRKMACFIGISRDRSKHENCISIDSKGNFVVNYTVTKDDAEAMLQGLEANVKFMAAAKANTILALHENFLPLEVNRHHQHQQQQCETAKEENASEEDDKIKVDKYVESLKREGVVPGKMLVFSAHQMGSCRMAVSSSQGPVSPSGELHDVEDLFVADASLFPTSLGINPMITIEAMSHMISRNVMQKLGKTPASTPASTTSTSW